MNARKETIKRKRDIVFHDIFTIFLLSLICLLLRKKKTRTKYVQHSFEKQLDLTRTYVLHLIQLPFDTEIDS